jgi:hypothetical protein
MITNTSCTISPISSYRQGAQRLLKAFRNLIHFRFNVHIVHHWVFPKDMFIAFLIAQSNMLFPCFSCLLHRSGSPFATAVAAVVVYCFDD